MFKLLVFPTVQFGIKIRIISVDQLSCDKDRNQYFTENGDKV